MAFLAALLFLPGLGWRDVWNPDEARYAQVAREMAEGGHVFVPHLNGEVYSEKPPLFFWAIMASSLLTGGVGETAARLPSALAALGAALLVFAMGRRLFGRRGAWLAAAAFTTCYKILWQGRFGQIDMLLTFWVALAMWIWLLAYTERRPRLYPLFFVVTGVATVTKGPAGFLPPLLALVAFLLICRERGELKRFRIGRGFLLWAAVVLSWLVPAGLVAGWGYVETMTLQQNLTRYADPWHHHQPFWYYLAVLPVGFFPWSFFLPAAVAVAWERLRGSTSAADPGPGGADLGGGSSGEGRNPDPTGMERKALLWVLCWVGVTLVFFSLSPAKRTVYVLTLYPALGLWVGFALDRFAARWPRRRGWVLGALGLLAALVALVAGALAVLGPERPELEILGTWLLPATLGAVILLLAGVVSALALAWRGQLPRAAGALAAGMAAFWLAASLVLLPRLDVVKSARDLSRQLVERVGAGDSWTVYPRLDAGFLFYSGLRAERLEGEGSEELEKRSLLRMLARDERVWVLARRDRLSGLEGLPALWEVARDRDREKGYLLLTNRPVEDGRRWRPGEPGGDGPEGSEAGEPAAPGEPADG